MGVSYIIILRLILHYTTKRDEIEKLVSSYFQPIPMQPYTKTKFCI